MNSRFAPSRRTRSRSAAGSGAVRARSSAPERTRPAVPVQPVRFQQPPGQGGATQRHQPSIDTSEAAMHRLRTPFDAGPPAAEAA